MKAKVFSLNEGDIQLKSRLGNWYFDHGKAVAVLLMNDVIKLTQRTLSSSLNLTLLYPDVFYPGSLNAMDLDYADVEFLYNFWMKDSVWGPAVFVAVMRGLKFNAKASAMIGDAGWNVEMLTTIPTEDLLPQLRTMIYELPPADA